MSEQLTPYAIRKAKQTLETAHQQYPMTLFWYHEVKRLAYQSKRADLEGDNAWRRPVVEDLYHALRAQGGSHRQAIEDVLAALPNLKADADGFAVYDDAGNENGEH